jgi:hypothetical protein
MVGDCLEVGAGLVSLGGAPGPAVHAPDFVRDAGGARDLAEPFPLAALPDRKAKLALHDSPYVLAMADALQEREHEPESPARDVVPAEWPGPHLQAMTTASGFARRLHASL